VLTIALYAYDAGFMPIPLRGEVGHRKRPALSTWRQYQTERPSRDTVAAWWPDDTLNLGLITGRVSGIVVVDLDGDVPDPVAWCQEHGFPVTTIARTGKGGAHLYYKHPGGAIGNGVKLATVSGVSIDLRADGGYVVAPPSLHDNGNRYAWVTGGFDGPFVPFPQELLGVMQSHTDYGSMQMRASEFLRSSSIDHLLGGVGRGERNDAAARMSGYWLKVTKGDELAAWQALCLWNTRNQPPLDDRELRQTYESICRRWEASPHEDAAPQAPEGDAAPVMDGAAWAQAVRNLPPRTGTPARSLLTLEEVGGLVPRDLVVLAGRPGMGKSTVAWNVCVEVCLDEPHLPTVVFSSEMTAHDVARWMASGRHRVPAKDLTQDQWHETLDAISRAPITVCDMGAVTVDQITEIVKARPETRLVVVDHIQRIGSGRSFGDNRNLEVGRIAQALKSLAKDLPCTVLALSQMNRASDTKDRPRLGALRDSGEIEQEADAVIFLWSQADDLTKPELPVEFSLAKNRHGALKHVAATFHKAQKWMRGEGLEAEWQRIRQEQQYRQQTHRLIHDSEAEPW
jgi:KaiC/GvpD/RAD55 family RecA-like ATPase